MNALLHFYQKIKKTKQTCKHMLHHAEVQETTAPATLTARRVSISICSRVTEFGTRPERKSGKSEFFFSLVRNMRASRHRPCLSSRCQQRKRRGHVSEHGQTGPPKTKTTQKLWHFYRMLVFVVFFSLSFSFLSLD